MSIREQTNRTSAAAAAYLQGEQACLEGDLRESNPYQCEQCRSFWFKGFDVAQVARDEWEKDNHDRAVMFG